VLAQDDQLRARDGLKMIEALQKDVGGRTAGTAFGSEQFDQDGM
jgi:hypothetical protein